MKAVSVFLSLMVVAQVRATTYYVATTGVDSHAGTASQPWRTLQHAVDSIAAGDTVLVGSGTYVGCRIGKPGTPTFRKTLAAAPNAHVLVNAPGPVNKHDSIIEIENFSFTMTDWTISGFEVSGSPKYGIDVRVTNRIKVTGNHVHNSALTGIFTAFSNYITISGNESDLNGEHGIYQSNSSIYPTIFGNRCHNNASCGIHMNGDISEQPGNGLVLYATVDSNVIYENGLSGGSGINCDGVDHSLIKNNLLYNNHASGISLYGIDGAQSSSYDQVYNNTIVMATGSRWPINIPDDGYKAAPVGNLVKNNILYTPDAGHGSIIVAGPAVSGFQSDYNVIVPTFSDDSDNTTISLTSWRALGYDRHSIVATPSQLFVSPGAFNFQLRAGSPAIDKGTTLTDVPVDILGVKRPQGPAYDIGCYEYKLGV